MAAMACTSMTLRAPLVPRVAAAHALAARGGRSLFRRARVGYRVCSATTAVCRSTGQKLEEVPSSVSRRAAGVMIATLVATGAHVGTAAADEVAIEVTDSSPGNGAVQIRKNSLVLLHYVGKVESTGEVFDSTRGGMNYLNSGEGIFRPLIIQVSGDPQPGVVVGLQQGLLGMTAGAKKTFKVPAELGFGSSEVVAPYAIVPQDAELTYEVEVLRVSNSGPDELMKYISNCGVGGAGAQSTGCADIVPM